MQKKRKNIPQYHDNDHEVDERGNVLTYRSQVILEDKVIGT